MYDAILEALRRGAVADALTAAREAVAARPDDPKAHHVLALALRQQGEAAAALESLDRALALAPEEPELHLARAGLLLGTRQLDAAQAALARSVSLDPNQFPAYLLQAHLALGRGDADEAERQMRLAARLAPDHPQVVGLEGLIALRRGRAEDAIRLLTAATRAMPDDPVLRNGLGFAFLAQGHLAFAEQAFRSVLAAAPGQASPVQRALLADIVGRQGRPDEAVAELEPLLAESQTATPGVRRQIGEWLLAAGRDEAAREQLEAAFESMPEDPRTLGLLFEAWRRLGERSRARERLDAALARRSTDMSLWQARLAVETAASAEARVVLERWLQAMPEAIAALEALAAMHDSAGETDAALAVARRILAQDPEHPGARLRVAVGHLIEADPAASIAELEALLERTAEAGLQRELRAWLGFAQDRAGRVHEAVATWMVRQDEVTAFAVARPQPTAPRVEWAEAAVAASGAVSIAWLWGPPGSGVEQLVAVGAYAGLPLLTDRFGPQPPADPLQQPDSAARLLAGELDPAALVAGWRTTLATRGVPAGQALIDWLPWWDNGLLQALRPHLPEALLLIALRDPRDMLLDWLAFGAPAGLAFESPQAAAAWLAPVLQQVAALHEQNLHPHRLLRLDEALDRPEALAAAITAALESEVPPPPRAALGPARLPPGRWRAYAEPLADAFALLAPVARRLGYPET
ncbi:tetratricopeptide repeat protein [Vulcaniibacterium gelatinicum]|uniref:tetratricopeptide repeat protein n=1 Tax=Vulcaniibacterium gelatinicum TaxID=2598725 RepID=UPI0015F2D879|nr:tetratricopeptide repeat protein [Vulcaniibacterium gelatinicum]